MTTPTSASPALASLALAIAPGAPQGPAGAASVAPGTAVAARPGPASETPVLQGFSALLLGLKAAAAGSAPAPAALPADAAGATGTEALPGLLPPAPPASVTAAGTLAALPDGKCPGNGLPGDGNELPPDDVEALLASLAAAPAPAAPVTNSPPPAAVPATDAAAGPAAVPAAAGQAPRPPVIALPADLAGDAAPTGPDAAAVFADSGQDAGDEAATAPGAADPARDAGVAATGRERGMELALPAEFRARLEALVNAAQRPAVTADAGALPVQGATAHATALSSVAAPAGATPDLFDGLPVLQPAGNADAWTQGLGDRLLMMAEKGLQSATIRLQPEHLGPMEIRIRVDDDGAANVLFSAHHAQTRDALETAIPRLRDMLAEQGLSLGQAGVDSGRGSFAQRGFAETAAPSWNGWDTAGEPEPPVPPDASVWRVGRGSERRLDVLV